MNDNDLIRRGDAETLIYALLDGEPAKDKWSDVGKRIADIPAAPHEMTAREFIRAYYRMCEGVNLHDCTDCPIRTAADSHKVTCEGLMRSYPDEAADLVEQWAKEHPEKKRKTYAEDFFEKFPKAEPKYYDGRGKKQMIPIPCRQHCYGVVGQKCNGIGCSCSACWNEEMEGEDE